MTFDKHRGVVNYSWAFTSKHILYTQDKNGDEDNHVYRSRPRLGRDQGPDAASRRSPRRSTPSASDSPRKSSSASTTAIHGFTTCIASTSSAASGSCCRRIPAYAGFMADDDYRVRFAVEDHARRRQRTAQAGGRRQVEAVHQGRAAGRDDDQFRRLRQDRREALSDRQPRPQHGRALLAIDLETGKQTADRRGHAGRRRRRARPSDREERSRRVSSLRSHRMEGPRSDAIAARYRLSQDGCRRRHSGHQPHAGRQALDRGLHDGRRPGAVLSATIASRSGRPTFLFTNRKSTWKNCRW